MSKVSDIQFNKIYEVVATDLLRRTFTNNPFPESREIQYERIATEEFIPVATSLDTIGALRKLNSWMADNRKNIVSACFFGSTVSNCTTDTSVSIPKEKGDYLLSTILVGPSDVDGLIVIDKKFDTFPTCFSTFNRYDSSCQYQDNQKIDLLANVIVVPLNELKSSFIFSERLFPMYYRMLVEAGYWVSDAGGIHDILVDHADGDDNSVIHRSYLFYSRRIQALVNFLNSLCINRVNSGYVYGSENCPDE